jgi:hypothetical protein
LFGWAYVPTIKWKPHFFEKAARMLMLALPPTAKVCLLGGLHSLDGMEAALQPRRGDADHHQGDKEGLRAFAAVAVARMVLHEPRIIRRMEACVAARQQGLSQHPSHQHDSSSSRRDVVSGCTHCNLCIVGSTMAETPLTCAVREATAQHDIEDLIT